MRRLVLEECDVEVEFVDSSGRVVCELRVITNGRFESPLSGWRDESGAEVRVTPRLKSGRARRAYWVDEEGKRHDLPSGG